MSYSQPDRPTPNPREGGDLPDWMISLSRQLIRDCRAPGDYTISFTIDDHRHRIHTAVISRVEKIRVMEDLR